MSVGRRKKSAGPIVSPYSFRKRMASRHPNEISRSPWHYALGNPFKVGIRIGHL
jgi:hypothetical protein